jgi:hypothetical protein
MYSVNPRAIAILILALLSLPAVAVSQVTYHCSSAEQATDEFRLAMKIFSRRSHSKDDWLEAISHLQKAVDFCPVPKNPIPPIVVAPFRPEFNYIPFYFLGSCHYKVDEPPEALRYFHLSSCFGEPKRDEDVTEDLGDLTDQSLKQIAQKKRPEKQPPYFGEGVTAAKTAKTDKDWTRSAEQMWDSMQVWPEDGKTTIIAGRWPVPYVPRFHLAKALFNLGCPQQACEQLAKSKLQELARNDTAAKRQYSTELTDFETLKAQCPSASKDLWICEQWKCWLERDRGQKP